MTPTSVKPTQPQVSHENKKSQSSVVGQPSPHQKSTKSKLQHISLTSPFILIPIVSVVLLGLNLIASILLVSSSSESQIVISHLEALRRNRQNVQKLETDLRNYGGKITQILDILPKEKDIPDFITFVTAAAESNNSSVVLNFTANQPTITKSKLAVIPLSLQLATTPQDLNNFIQSLQSDKFQLRLEHIEVDFTSRQSQQILVRLSGKLYVNSQFAIPN